MQGAAHAAVDFDLQDAGAALGREYRRRPARRAGARNDQVIIVAQDCFPAMPIRGLSRSMGSGNTIVLLPSLDTSVSVCR